jgi:hypothetical protein
MIKIELFARKILCFFGIHDWIEQTKMDKFFYKDFSHRCFWCSKRAHLTKRAADGGNAAPEFSNFE